MVTDYMSVNEASKKWDISVRRIQKLCAENRINGAVRFSRVWAIPRNAQKPIDGRLKSQRERKQNRA
ncbi:hypothetical protein [Caldicellulosiruptor saccharolyticus]|uniref:hypothetical protein n=1 Tax=Caldicellulosiruptor saccharolyticus TaxID=44001 RepID=UPI00030F979F|nr:hypothetical protein [Caldicellulosiruptor saccharolyticus]